MVLDFFKNLVRYRVESVRAQANAKIYGATAKAKSKASSKFNNAVDKPFKAAKEKVKGAGKKGQKKAKKAAEKAKAKGGKKKKGGGAEDDGGADQGGQQKQAKGKKKGGKVFGGKKNKGAPAAPPPEVEEYGEMDPGMRTQAIDISSMVDDRAQDVVGWIVCLNGAQRGRDFRLVTGRNVVGTAADCDIVVTDPYLSSKHMAIRHEDGRFTLIDLDSTNGTFLNDRRCSKEELIDNDKIRIGRTERKFKSLC